MRGPRSSPREDIVLFHGQEALHDIQARETLLSRFNHALHRLDEASQELDLGRYTLPVHVFMAQRPG
jgi:hypothetical protein